jgi:hypothetical protein
MNQDEILKLILGAVISSSVLSSLLTTFLNNYFTGRREKEKSRKETLENRIKPAEEYLKDLQSLLKKVITVACNNTIPENLKKDIQIQFFDFGTRIAVIQPVKIIDDNAMNKLIDEFPSMMQDFVVSINILMNNPSQENEECVSMKREEIQMRILSFLSIIDSYRLNGYKPINKISRIADR